MSLLCFLLLEHYLLKAATLLILQDLCCILVLFILLCQLFLLFFQWCLFYDLEIHVPFRGGKKKKRSNLLIDCNGFFISIGKTRSEANTWDTTLDTSEKLTLFCSVTCMEESYGTGEKRGPGQLVGFQAQERSSLVSRKSSQGGRRPVWMGEEGTPDKAQTWKLKLLAYTRAEPGDRGIVYRHWACRNGVRKARAHLELNSVRDVKLLKVH